MKIEHLAVWTGDLERLRSFYERYFGARAGRQYVSANTPGLRTYFLTFPSGGARLELMTQPGLPDTAGTAGAGGAGTAAATGYAHLAVSVGSRQAVEALVSRMRAEGVHVASGPRETGDGYYEAVVLDPDGNHVEVSA